MDLRSLITKLDTIAEDLPPMPADGGRAQYDKFKADDARAAAIAKVKALMATPLNAIPRLGDAIDPKTGIIYYGEANDSSGQGTAKPYPYDWLKDPSSTSDQSRQMYSILAPAGLKVIPVEKKSLFGSYQVAGISPQALANLDKPVAPTPDKPEQNTKPVRQAVRNDNHVAQLNALSAKLQARIDALSSVKKESHQSIADALVESFGYQTENDLAKTAAVGAGTYGATKAAGKMLGKAIPGVGLAFGTADAYNRAKKGDYVGAGIAGLSGVTSLLPGLGTAATVGLDAANIARDYKKGEFNDILPANMAANTDKTQHTKPAGVLPPGADPAVFHLQKKLIAAGAKIKHDGKMGPATQAAMKQFPNVKESLAESMGSLRDRLALLEREQRDYSPAQEVQADEGIYGDALELGAKGAKYGKKGVDSAVDWSKNLFKGADDAKVVKPNAPTTTPTGTVHKAKADNPNIAGQNPYVQGRAGSGPNATQFAKFDPATSTVANATQGIGNMTKGGVKAAGSVDDVAKAAGKGPGWAKKIGTAAAVGAGAYGLSTLLDKDKPEDKKKDPAVVTGPVTPPGGDQNTKPDAEAQAIIDQMKEIMKGYEADDSAEWSQATSNAMALIGKVEGKKGGEAQVASDREAAMRAPDMSRPVASNATADTTKGPNMGQVNKSTQGVPAGTAISK